MTLTPLERAAVSRIADTEGLQVDVSALRVSRRENTGVGRYVYFVDEGPGKLSDGLYQSNDARIDMAGLPLGLDCALMVENGRVVMLELVTPDPNGWDGVERTWRLSD